MKSSNQVQFLRSVVDLDGYASSANWIGFFESKNKDKDFDKSDVVISLFDKMIGFRLKEAVLICAFIIRSYAWNDDQSIERDQQERIANKLESRKWTLSVFNDDKDFENLQQFSLLYDEDIKLINELLWLVLNGFTYGHVFLVWEDLDLILYPHMDCGFGFLAPKNGSGYQIAMDFFDVVENNVLFNVYRNFKSD